MLWEFIEQIEFGFNEKINQSIGKFIDTDFVVLKKKILFPPKTLAFCL